jgi:hypothetical protein
MTMDRFVFIVAALTPACGYESTPSVLSLHGEELVVVEHLGPVATAPSVALDGKPLPVLWTMDAEGVAVIEDGTIRAISPGEVNFSVDHQGQTVSWTLSVDPQVMIRFVDPPIRMVSGDSAPLMLHGEVDGVPVQPIGVGWASSDERIAKVVTGHVTARRPGVAWITAATRHAEAVLELEVVLQEPASE